MNQVRRLTLRIFHARRFGVLALAFLALLLTSSIAKAGCAVPFKGAATTSSTPPIPFVSPHADGDRDDRATIVGLWHVLYTGDVDDNFPPGGPYPPTPFPFLESFKTWHADGTEFENAFLPPAGGNICFGVWKEVGDRRVKLHHIGLMFASDGTISAIFTDDEMLTVAHDGKTYKGTFDFRLWPPTYVAVGVGKPISEVTGTIAATRITVD